MAENVHPDLFNTKEALAYLHLPEDAERTLKTFRDKEWLTGYPSGPDGACMYWRDDLDACALQMVGRAGKNNQAASGSRQQLRMTSR